MTAPSALHGLAASLVCVGTNSFPALSLRLHSHAAQSDADHQAAPGILEVLGNHGGERFGEKDNTNELAVLQAWIVHRINSRCPQGNPPSFDTLFGQLLDSDEALIWPPARIQVSEIELVKDGKRINDGTAFEKLLVRKWPTTKAEPPSLLFVKGPVSVATLTGTSVVDFTASDLSEAEMLSQKAQLDAAHSAYSDAQQVLQSIGIPDVSPSCKALLDSIAIVRTWVEQPSSDPLIIQSQFDLKKNCPMLTNTQLWQGVVKHVDTLQNNARYKLETLSRKPRYVLRAFIVKAPNQQGSAAVEPEQNRNTDTYTVVRRFGKTEGASHFSVLGNDGVCWATRAADIKGTVVESMWVCCSDDDECRPAIYSNGSVLESAKDAGINTVVADPEDEIFCDICLELTSWSYDQIIICDGCERGVHQMCHDPVVTEDELTQDEWFCINCVRKKANDKNDSSVKRQRTG
ncbi:hypothetical protein IW150_002379 [Coemansia sp. RSA 2607]|nr:hypothetical protein IW150_002379 [Coemansia sp. RSA 2607]